MTAEDSSTAPPATGSDVAATAASTSESPSSPTEQTLSTRRDSSWPAVLFYIHLNILGLYGVIVLFTNTYYTTVIFTFLLTFMGIIGATCGAHRLWAHQTYKANTFLRIILMLCQTMAGQVGIHIILCIKHIAHITITCVTQDLQNLSKQNVRKKQHIHI